MAPLLKVLVKFLPATSRWSTRTETPTSQAALGRTNFQQEATIACHDSTKDPVDNLRDQISAVSWGVNRLDVFALQANNLTHKYWDGHQWSPSNEKMETLGNGLATPPVAVTWGTERLDVFGLDDHNVIKHQYWDGSAWQPSVHELENLGGGCDPKFTIAAITLRKDHLDVFCVGLDKQLRHQYYDGSQWLPETGSTEILGGPVAGDLSVVSWGKDRMDIFSVDADGTIVHLYWTGHALFIWETLLGAPVAFKSVTASSWGEDRLDLFAVSSDVLGGNLYHMYWDGTGWSDWERLDSDDILTFASGRPSVTSWAPNRLDVVMARDIDQTYYYKYWDGIGQAWRPSIKGWYTKGTKKEVFASNPATVSWGANRLDIFGSTGGELLHQAWTGADWYPGATHWEVLGNYSAAHVMDGKSFAVMQAVSEQHELRK